MKKGSVQEKVSSEQELEDDGTLIKVIWQSKDTQLVKYHKIDKDIVKY